MTISKKREPSFEDKLELVAGGHAVGVLAAGDRRATLREDLTTVPIDGMSLGQVILVTRRNDHDRLVRSFGLSARMHLTAPASTR